MANTIFTPTLSQGTNQISVQQPVQDAGTLEATLGLATEVGVDILRDQATSELREELGVISKARIAGGNRHKLTLKAKTALNKAKANAPAFVKDFDSIYGEVLGGSSGGSIGAGNIMAATPVEKGQEAAITEASERATLTGETIEEAAESLGTLRKMQAMADIQKAEDVVLAGKKSRNLGEVMVANVSSTRIAETDILTSMKAVVKNNGALTPESITMFKNSMAEVRRQLVEKLDSEVMSSKGLLIDQESYNVEIKRIDDMIARQETLLSNNSSQKLYTDLVATKGAEEQLVFMKALPLLNAAKSPEVAGRLLELYTNPDSNWSASIRANNPLISNLVDNPAQFKEASLTGFNKLFDPVVNSSNINELEKQSISTTLANPDNSVAVNELITMTTEDASARSKLEDVTNYNPDALAPWWSDSALKYNAQQNIKKYRDTIASQLNGAATRFKSIGIASTGELPTNVTVTESTYDYNYGAGSSGAKRVTVKGDGVTREMAQVARTFYVALQANPAMVKEYADMMDLPPESANAGVITSVVMSGGVKGARFEQVQMKDPRTAPVTSQDNKFISGPRGKIPVEEKPKKELVEPSVDVVERFESAMARANTPVLKGEVYKAFLNGFFERDVNGGVNLPDEAPAKEVQEVLDNPKQLDDSFKSQLAFEENRGKNGFDGEVWRPHESVEGGNPTIAYGHKLTDPEMESGIIKVGDTELNIREGITEEQAQILLEHDIERETSVVRRVVDNFEELPDKYQKVLVAIQFNTGDASKDKWPKLYKAIKEGNDKEVRKQMLTSYNEGGEAKNLSSRRDRIADVLGL